MNWLTDNRLAIIALSAIAGMLIFATLPAGVSNVMSTIAGGLIGFLQGQRGRTNGETP